MPVMNRGGVSLCYDDSGDGIRRPFVLIHCWGGDNSFMVEQFNAFRRRHRVVAPDLRGFGRSDKPEQKYSIQGFSDDVAWLCERLDLRKPVLLGQSMGGTIALEIAARHPDLAAAVVILDALVVAPPALVDNFRPVLEALRTPAHSQVVRDFSLQLLGPHFDPAAKARLADRLASNPQHVMVSALEDVLAHDSAAAAAKCKVPVMYVSSGPWYTDVERFHTLCPQLVTAQAVGCGHYLHLEVPEQVNPMIDRFVRIHASG